MQKDERGFGEVSADSAHLHELTELIVSGCYCVLVGRSITLSHFPLSRLTAEVLQKTGYVPIVCLLFYCFYFWGGGATMVCFK